jgi:hypothetical protein
MREKPVLSKFVSVEGWRTAMTQWQADRITELERVAVAFDEWIEKTQWVQQQSHTFPANALGKHRADVMREEIERLRQQLAASADKTAVTVQPVAKVRVRNKGYGMELSTYVAYALPEGMHDLYAAPQPQAAQSEDSRDAARWRYVTEVLGMRFKPSNERAKQSIEETNETVDAGIAALAQAGKEGA